MEQNQEYATFGRQVGYVVATNVAIMLLGLVQLPILTRGLGASLYGVFSLINVTVSLIVPFALLGLGTSIVRFLAAEKDKNRVRDDFLSACCVVAVAGACLSLLLFLLSDVLAESIFKEPGAASYIRLASVLVLLNALHLMPLAFFRMGRQIGRFAVFSLFYHVFQIGLVLAAILFGYRLGGVIIALIINGILFNVVTLSIVVRQIGFHRFRLSNMKAYLKWGIPLTPNLAFMWIIRLSDRYMVSYFLGVASAGIYGAAHRIGDYASFAVGPLSAVLYPMISRHYDEGNLAETRTYLGYSVKYLMMVAIPAAFGLSVLARSLLQILTTADFVAGSVVVPWVASGAVLFGFRRIGGYILHLVGKPQITVRLLGTAAVLNIGLNLLLIPRLGILGAALATLVAYGVLGMLNLLVTRRYLKFDLNLPFVGKSLVSAAVMALCIRLIGPEGLWPVLLSIPLGGVIYFAVLLALRGLSKGELTFFAGFVKDNLRKTGLFKG